jgi:hypothetical protein
VAVLENQNKALIEELKSLKELYTGGKMMWRESTSGQNIFLQTLVKNCSTLTETKTCEKKDWVNETDSASRTYLCKENTKWSIVRFVLRSYPWSFVLLP